MLKIFIRLNICYSSQPTYQYVMDGYSFSVLVGMTGSLRSSALVVASLHTAQTPFASCSLQLNNFTWFALYFSMSISTSKNYSHHSKTCQFHQTFTTMLDNATKVLQNFVFKTFCCNYCYYKQMRNPIPRLL